MRALAVAGPDEGARRVLSERAGAGEVDEIDVEIDATDLDTVEDVRKWEQAANRLT